MRSVNVTTTDQYSYKQFWYTVTDEEYSVVEVKGCKDIHILLSTGMDMFVDGYEVGLGTHNNTWSVVRESPYGLNNVTVETPGIVSCHEYRYNNS